jgi:hypothetical protein
MFIIIIIVGNNIYNYKIFFAIANVISNYIPMTSWKCIHISLWKANITLAEFFIIILVEYYFLLLASD